MKALLAFLSLGLALAQTPAPAGPQLAFSPQGGKRVQLWVVVGCGVKPVPAAQLYAIATSKGVPWLTPEAAANRLSKQSTWGRIARYTGYAAAGATVVLGFDWVKARPEWDQGVGMGSTFLNALLPFATKNIPTIDPNAGKGLAVGSDGCGQASFYALPGVGGPFIAQLAP